MKISIYTFNSTAIFYIHLLTLDDILKYRISKIFIFQKNIENKYNIYLDKLNYLYTLFMMLLRQLNNRSMFLI